MGLSEIVNKGLRKGTAFIAIGAFGMAGSIYGMFHYTNMIEDSPAISDFNQVQETMESLAPYLYETRDSSDLTMAMEDAYYSLKEARTEIVESNPGIHARMRSNEDAQNKMVNLLLFGTFLSALTAMYGITKITEYPQNKKDEYHLHQNPSGLTNAAE